DVLPSKSIKKPDLVRWLLFTYDFGIISNLIKGTEPVVKVCHEAEVMLMKFLFFGNRHADMTEFVIRDLGHIRFQSFDEAHLSIQFVTRKGVHDTLTVSPMKETFDELTQPFPPEEIFDWFMDWQTGIAGSMSAKAC